MKIYNKKFRRCQNLEYPVHNWMSNTNNQDTWININRSQGMKLGIIHRKEQCYERIWHIIIKKYKLRLRYLHNWEVYVNSGLCEFKKSYSQKCIIRGNRYPKTKTFRKGAFAQLFTEVVKGGEYTKLDMMLRWNQVRLCNIQIWRIDLGINEHKTQLRR